MKYEKGFTLIELLIVIGIIGVLAAAVVLFINPAEILNRTRDSARVQDLQAVHSALNLYELDEGDTFGQANTVYISIPDTSATCANLTLPSLPSPAWTYNCETEADLRKVDGTGWVPVDFTSISGSSPLSKLPIDPVNSDTDNLYYAYVTGGSWALSALFQAERHDTATNDGGSMVGVFEIGNDLTLTPPSRDMDLVGYWPMDEGSGMATADVSGENNGGTITGAIRAATTSCKIGRCLDFDGVNDYVDFGAGSSIDLADTLTATIWFKGDTVLDNFSNFLNKTQVNVVGWGVEVISTGPNIKARIDTSAGFNQQFTIGSAIDNTWHHVALVLDSGNIRAYLDAVETVDTTYTVGAGLSTGDPLRSGNRSDNTNFFHGALDDARIYNRALSEGEIKAIFNATK